MSWETEKMQLMRYVSELENKTNSLLQDNQRITLMAEERNREIDAWKSKYNSNPLQADVSVLQKKLAIAQDSIYVGWVYAYRYRRNWSRRG